MLVAIVTEKLEHVAAEIVVVVGDEDGEGVGELAFAAGVVDDVSTIALHDAEHDPVKICSSAPSGSSAQPVATDAEVEVEEEEASGDAASVSHPPEAALR